jgi:hypothetical protein
MKTQEAEKWLKDNGFNNACIRIDEHHRPDLYVSDVLIKYAQQQAKSLNTPAAIKSVRCDKCKKELKPIYLCTDCLKDEMDKM